MNTFKIESIVEIPIVRRNRKPAGWVEPKVAPPVKAAKPSDPRPKRYRSPSTTPKPPVEDTWSNARGQSFKVVQVKRMLAEMGVTQESLNILFSYDPETGIVTRKIFVNSRAKKGDVVGYKGADGYLRVRIANTNYQLHRIIWMMVYGYFPENQLDHISRVRDDNRLCNLREVSQSCNMRNASMQKRNRSGVTGICYVAKDRTWQVTISDFKRPTYLGRFLDFTEAVCHRYAAEQCLDYEDCDSNSPAYQYLKEQGIIK